MEMVEYIKYLENERVLAAEKKLYKAKCRQERLNKRNSK